MMHATISTQFENFSFSSSSVLGVVMMTFRRGNIVKKFKVNHPFFFALIGHESESVYFSGRMTDF
jgi:serine protease inhibitor